MRYAPRIKSVRMIVTRDALDSGSLELLTALGAVMGSTKLDSPSGDVVGDTLVFGGFPKNLVMSIASTWAERVASARMRSPTPEDVIEEMSVGLSLTAAPLWAPNTNYSADQTRTNGPDVYRCVVPGLSDLVGPGPAGQGASIVDGAARWDWVCKADAELLLSTLVWGVGDQITVQVRPSIRHAP